MNYFTLIFGCHNSDVTLESTQVERSVSMDDHNSVVLGAPETPVENVIHAEQLSVSLTGFSELDKDKQQHMTAMLNLATPPCEPCFEQFTYAECIVKELECSIIGHQLPAVYQRLAKGQSYEEALEVLQFQDLWFDDLQDPSHSLTVIIAAESSESVGNYLNEIIPNFYSEESTILFYDQKMKTMKRYAGQNLERSLSFDFQELEKISVLDEDWLGQTSSKLQEIDHRSNPTIYMNGYRARGMQSVNNLNHLSARGLELIENKKSSWEN